MRTPDVPQCCGAPMARRITTTAPVFVSEAHYEGLRASDGTDISTREKHRAYMRARGLTTIDDYAQQWQRDERARRESMAGSDPTRRQDIAEAIRQLEAKG